MRQIPFINDVATLVHQTMGLLIVFCIASLFAHSGCSEVDVPEGVNHTINLNEPGDLSLAKSPLVKTAELPFELQIETEPGPWKFIILHHTATDSGSVESIHNAHSQRRDGAGNPWKGIGYHFLIGNGNGMEDGEVAATFRWEEQISGAHAGSRQFNDHGIGICLVGNFENKKPTVKQVKNTSRLVSLLQSEFGITTRQVLKHGDLKATACPGRQFPFDDIIASVSQGSEIAGQQLGGSHPGLFSPVRPHSMEVISNVAAISRRQSGSREPKRREELSSSGQQQ